MRESLTRKLVRERVSQRSWCERESHREVGERERESHEEVGERERVSQGSW